MTFSFARLQRKSAHIIADDWKYDGPYSFYDMTADIEDYNELVNEVLWGDTVYFEATAEGELAGFFALTPEADDIEIGLGLRPDLCGRGFGREFLEQIIDYIHTHYTCPTLCLSVATFNERAIRVYTACGFARRQTYMQETNGGQYEFVKMTRGQVIIRII